MTSDLQPGDLCVTVRAAPWSIADEMNAGAYIGRTVVLIAPGSNPPSKRYGPYWRVSGMPKEVKFVAAGCLRKIPPAPLGTDITTDQEMTI